MSNAIWIEMPSVGSGAEGDPVRAKYTIRAHAFLVHQGGKVYVMCRDQIARERALRHPDCRQLAPDEAQAFEQGLQLPVPPELFVKSNDADRPVGLGDIVGWLAARLGIAECSACHRRRQWLNRIVVWGWWRRAGVG